MTYRIFEERRKGVVSHTAASKLLAEDPGLNNFVGFVANELWPATSGLTEAITKWGASDEPNHSVLDSYQCFHPCLLFWSLMVPSSLTSSSLGFQYRIQHKRWHFQRDSERS